MDEHPNWCPNCEKETDWLINPSQPNIVQCKECGHLKKMSGVKVKRTSAKVHPSSESIVTIGLAFQIALAIAFGGFLVGSIWLFLVYLYIQQGIFILAIIFSVLAGLSVSTVAVYCILSEAEKIVEKKIKQK